MLHFLIAFICTACCLFFILKTVHKHRYISGDLNLNSPQKFHSTIVPRVGGFAIIFACFTVLIYDVLILQKYLFAVLIVCAVPLIAIGLLEDILKDTKPTHRLYITALSCILFMQLTTFYIERVNIGWLDQAPIYFFLLLTIVGMTGIVNAVNIIDGFNGLACMFFIMVLSSMLYVNQWLIHSHSIHNILMTLIAANVAFFYYNYPNGRLFLGDAGAYFMGFVLSSLIIMFVCKQPSISAWYGFTLMIYPITEALFSIYRKKIVRKSSPFMPDGLHLHMLIYKRCLPKFKHLPKKQAQLKRNMLTSPILWLLSLVGIVPATLFAQNTLYLQISCLLFVLIYLLFYTLIVRFKIQRFLLLFRQTFKLNGN